MINGTSSTGFKFELPDDCLNDMEILEDLILMESGDPIAMTRVINGLFDSKQKKALYDHVRNERGRVGIDAVSNELKEIFEAIGDKGKNL